VFRIHTPKILGVLSTPPNYRAGTYENCLYLYRPTFPLSSLPLLCWPSPIIMR